MSMPPRKDGPLARKSRTYGIAQTMLLVVYAGVFMLDPSRRLFAPGIPGSVGLVLCAAGLVLMAGAFAVIRGVIQVAPEPRADGYLVTDGVYRRLRHPIYTAIVLLASGLFLRKPTAAVAIAGLVVIAFLVVKARFEEKLLMVRYPAYAEYKNRTWGVVPFIGR
jgi:protein-S-isoprenylcysteine O-methyltransferase Ste14